MVNILVTDTDRFRNSKETRNISDFDWLDFDGSQNDIILKYTKSDFGHENKIQTSVKSSTDFRDQDILHVQVTEVDYVSGINVYIPSVQFRRVCTTRSVINKIYLYNFM